MTDWQPILEGPLAERAWESVTEIAAALDPATLPPLDEDAAEPAGNPPEWHPSLASGTTGRALFFAYRLHAGRGTAADQESAETFLAQATGALASVPLSPDLYGGFAGVAWAAEHLYGPRFADEDETGAPAEAAGEAGATAAADGTDGTEDDDGDPLVEIDAALTSYLGHTPWQSDYDLIRGLTGIGVYAIERLPRESALVCLRGVLDRLSETAQRTPEGVTWHTAPALLPDWQRQIYPDGYYNLGVAHGVPGTISMLASAAAATERVAAAGGPQAATAAALARQARDLAAGAVSWLQTQRLAAGSNAWFGTASAPGVAPQPSRLAWCYGDPGVAAALLVAGRACGEAAWEKQAIELAIDTIERPLESAGVRDPGLCHGAGGLAHLFNRIYQTTGEPRFADASRRWFERTLDYRRPGEGVAGYSAYWLAEPGDPPTWRADPGLLEGAAGVGLALLGAVGGFEPAWDRVLAISSAAAAQGQS